MTFEVFLILLFIVSSLTALTVEGIKKILEESKKTYKANILAGTSAAAISVGVGAAYIIITETALNEKMAVYLIALVFLSWLSSMLGYDKVKQTIMQFKITNNEQ